MKMCAGKTLKSIISGKMSFFVESEFNMQCYLVKKYTTFHAILPVGTAHHLFFFFFKGAFPYKCDICEKIFNHRSHLNVHLQTHTGAKPYKCVMCPKEFSRKSSLKQHLRTHGITDFNMVSGSVSSSTASKPPAAPEVIQDEDVDSNFSDASFLEGTPAINMDPSNIQVFV